MAIFSKKSKKAKVSTEVQAGLDVKHQKSVEANLMLDAQVVTTENVNEVLSRAGYYTKIRPHHVRAVKIAKAFSFRGKPFPYGGYLLDLGKGAVKSASIEDFENMYKLNG